MRIHSPDPNTLNLDPDPDFWPNLDQDPGPVLCHQFGNLEETLKIVLQEKNQCWGSGVQHVSCLPCQKDKLLREYCNTV